MRDIYIRNEDDPKFNPNILEVSNNLELLISKLFMLLNTREGDVLGDVGFGLNLEDYIFTFDFSEDRLKEEISKKIYIYIPELNEYDFKIEVKRFRGTVRDMVLLDFFIDGRKTVGVLVK